MLILKFFNTSTEKHVAAQMADKLAIMLPPATIESKSRILSVNKVTRQIEDVLNIAIAHQRQHCPGFFKRAVLANSFKWNLLDKGYSQEFANIATEACIMETTKVMKDKTKQ